MPKIPVTVCLIAKNEEVHMEECLKRLKPYGFEIVVTDTGSEDRTREIARKYADKVLDFPWTDDFSAARNFCAQNASNRWILALDCDEYISSLDVNLMRILMQKFPKNLGVIRLKNLTKREDGSTGYGTDEVTRFYNKSFYTFDAPIHEQICTRDVSRRGENLQCFLLPMEVIHHGYALSEQEMQAKQERNLEMLYSLLEKNPQDAYTLFQIGQSQFILKHNDKAITYYERALSLNPGIEYMYTQVLIESLAKAYLRAERGKDAIALMEQYAPYCKTAKFVYTQAMVYGECGQTMKALLLYIKTTTLADVDTLGEGLLRCYEKIIQIYTRMGNLDMANVFQEKYRYCLEERKRVVNS